MPDDPRSRHEGSPTTDEDRADALIHERGSRDDVACPRCHRVGYRRVADSEMVAIFACRHCGYQAEQVHETRATVDQPFREYRERRRTRPPPP